MISLFYKTNNRLWNSGPFPTLHTIQLTPGTEGSKNLHAKSQWWQDQPSIHFNRPHYHKHKRKVFRRQYCYFNTNPYLVSSEAIPVSITRFISLQKYQILSKIITKYGAVNHFSLETLKMIIGKQCRPRSDATECGLIRVSTVYK